jgi:hypothetical protein
VCDAACRGLDPGLVLEPNFYRRTSRGVDDPCV